MNILEMILRKHDIKRLDKQHTIEALFYVTQLLKTENNAEKLTQYNKIREDLQNRIDEIRHSHKGTS